MSEKEDKQKENERLKNEWGDRYKGDENLEKIKKDITKIQAPDKWPEPPKESDDD